MNLTIEEIHAIRLVFKSLFEDHSVYMEQRLHNQTLLVNNKLERIEVRLGSTERSIENIETDIDDLKTKLEQLEKTMIQQTTRMVQEIAKYLDDHFVSELKDHKQRIKKLEKLSTN